MKLCKKQKFLASRLQRPGMTSSLKKLLTDCFKTLADGPKTGLLAARAISTVLTFPRAHSITQAVGDSAVIVSRDQESELMRSLKAPCKKRY